MRAKQSHPLSRGAKDAVVEGSRGGRGHGGGKGRAGAGRTMERWLAAAASNAYSAVPIFGPAAGTAGGAANSRCDELGAEPYLLAAWPAPPEPGAELY